MKFPHGLEPHLLTRDSRVIEAERCELKDREQDRTVTTRQVLIKARGTFPGDTIDLNWYGRYQLRPYTPEPRRCYRCQRFGHHQKTCTKPYICAVCSGRHNTEECFARKKNENISAEAKCPNYRRHHPAWSLNCPARKQVIRGSIMQSQRQTMPSQPQQLPSEAPRLNDPADFPAGPTPIPRSPPLPQNLHQPPNHNDPGGPRMLPHKRTQRPPQKHHGKKQRPHQPPPPPEESSQLRKSLKMLLKGLAALLNPQADTSVMENSISSLIQSTLEIVTTYAPLPRSPLKTLMLTTKDLKLMIIPRTLYLTPKKTIQKKKTRTPLPAIQKEKTMKK
ncbi:hypothetical protein E2C01_026742 [Portunus trituberculatus]|uniref:CCHC-type domain-containing protein n=1 Tax=Portunus trituberculatus TaxID=210409 RepID=A0A5B7EK14_PORTR|nr:hypothetical protein [Portunus trituberculatus]